MRKEDRRDVGVVLDQIALGDAELGPEGLVEIGEGDFLALDFQFRVTCFGDVDGGDGHTAIVVRQSRLRALLERLQPDLVVANDSPEVRVTLSDDSDRGFDSFCGRLEVAAGHIALVANPSLERLANAELEPLEVSVNACLELLQVAVE